MAKSKTAETGPATVYPVAGRYLDGVPTRPTITTDSVAARLVATGAFTYDAPEVPEGETPEIVVEGLPEGALDGLDFYDPPPPAEPEQGEAVEE